MRRTVNVTTAGSCLRLKRFAPNELLFSPCWAVERKDAHETQRKVELKPCTRQNRDISILREIRRRKHETTALHFHLFDAEVFLPPSHLSLQLFI